MCWEFWTQQICKNCDLPPPRSKAEASALGPWGSASNTAFVQGNRLVKKHAHFVCLFVDWTCYYHFLHLDTCRIYELSWNLYVADGFLPRFRWLTRRRNLASKVWRPQAPRPAPPVSAAPWPHATSTCIRPDVARPKSWWRHCCSKAWQPVEPTACETLKHKKSQVKSHIIGSWTILKLWNQKLWWSDLGYKVQPGIWCRTETNVGVHLCWTPGSSHLRGEPPDSSCTAQLFARNTTRKSANPWHQLDQLGSVSSANTKQNLIDQKKWFGCIRMPRTSRSLPSGIEIITWTWVKKMVQVWPEMKIDLNSEHWFDSVLHDSFPHTVR